jgi:hypothetical protein
MDIVFKNLNNIPHSRSYKRKDIPDRYHYKSHERIGDILLVLEPGYEINQYPSRMNTAFYFYWVFFLIKRDIKVAEKNII